jgi:hypothetical protein
MEQLKKMNSIDFLRLSILEDKKVLSSSTEIDNYPEDTYCKYDANQDGSIHFQNC